MPDEFMFSRTKAAEYIGMPQSFLKNSREMVEIRAGRRIQYKKSDLDRWKEMRDSRIFKLDLSDYAKCFDFALAMYYRGYTTIDWGTARRREAGQNITNWIRGQLGEIAVQKFLKSNFSLEVKLDFDLHKDIVPQDVIGVKKDGRWRDPKIKAAVKGTKFQNSYLILGTADVEPENRKSDVYILTRTNLPDDHLMRVAKEELEELLKKQQHFEAYKEKLLPFEPIPCEVVGFAYRDELEKIEDTNRLAQILGTRNPTGSRYVKPSGELRSSKQDWKEIIKRI